MVFKFAFYTKLILRLLILKIKCASGIPLQIFFLKNAIEIKSKKPFRTDVAFTSFQFDIAVTAVG